jgi:hypothetical protein
MSNSTESRTRSPQFERLTQIVMDHLFFAERYPDKLDEISTHLNCSQQAALAVAISDQITEEFSLTEREDI